MDNQKSTEADKPRQMLFSRQNSDISGNSNALAFVTRRLIG